MRKSGGWKLWGTTPPWPSTSTACGKRSSRTPPNPGTSRRSGAGTLRALSPAVLFVCLSSVLRGNCRRVCRRHSGTGQCPQRPGAAPGGGAPIASTACYLTAFWLGYQAMCSLLHSNALALLITIAGSAALYFVLLLAIDRKLELKSGSRISNRKGNRN